MNELFTQMVRIILSTPWSFWATFSKLGCLVHKKNTNLQLSEQNSFKLVERLRLGTVRMKWVEKHRTLLSLNRLTDHHSF